MTRRFPERALGFHHSSADRPSGARCPERSRGNTAGRIGGIATVRGGQSVIYVWSRQKPSWLRCHRRHGMTIAPLDPAKEAEQAIENRQWMRRASGNPQIDGN
jgi:hypothetical protein